MDKVQPGISPCITFPHSPMDKVQIVISLLYHDDRKFKSVESLVDPISISHKLDDTQIIVKAIGLESNYKLFT
jgi:hypothetical protein